MSPRSPLTPRSAQHLFSREGFVPLDKSADGMAPHDVTVNIPMASVPQSGQSSRMGSKDGWGKQSSFSQASTEKGTLFNRHAGIRRAKVDNAGGALRKSSADDEDDEILTQMGKLYNRILNFSLVTRYFLYILPIGLLIAIPIIIGATVAKKATIAGGTPTTGVRIVWFFSWVELVWGALWVSKLFAHYLPSIFQFLCGIVSSGTRKYALALRALETPLSLVGWALTSFAAFKQIMTNNPDNRRHGKDKPIAPQHWIGVVNTLLAATLVASLIFLGEKAIIQLISMGYHRKQFNSKIKDSKRSIGLLSLLYEASRTLFPAYCNEFEEEDYLINDAIAINSRGKNGHTRSGSATPMRMIQNLGRVGDKLTSAFGSVAQEITGKEVFKPNSPHSIVVEALEKTASSEALAKRLWMSFVVEGKEALYREDLVEVLGPDRQTEANEAFDIIDKDGNGDISLDEMIMAVVQMGRDRHSIATSMHDVDQAINVLDKLFCAITFVIVIFVYVGFLNTSFTTTLATAGTALLSMSFVFASTAAEVLGSCIFLFVKHPYDVGDRVDISKDQLIVERISLLFTVFKRVDNAKTVQIPNIVLNTLWIENISRSKAMREQVNMFINFDTTFDDIQALRDELFAFVRNKENSRDFVSDIDVEVMGIAEMNKLELRVEIKYKSNWANETLRAARRSKFMCALVLALRKVPIYGPGAGDAALGDLGKPTYSVSVTDAEAAANREAFAAKKEAKRLFPTKTDSPPDVGKPASKPTAASNSPVSKQSPSSKGNLGSQSEQNAVLALNVRNPVGDRDGWDAYREQLTVPSTGIEEEDAQRQASLDEVRGVLRRSSTRGRRKASSPYNQSISSVAEMMPAPGKESAPTGVLPPVPQQGYPPQGLVSPAFQASQNAADRSRPPHIASLTAQTRPPHSTSNYPQYQTPPVGPPAPYQPSTAPPAPPFAAAPPRSGSPSRPNTPSKGNAFATRPPQQRSSPPRRGNQQPPPLETLRPDVWQLNNSRQ